MYRVLLAVALLALTFGFTITGYAEEIDLSTLLEHHQAPVFLQSSGQTYLLGVAVEQRDGKPPLSVMRIAGESLLGGAGTFAGAILAFYTAHFVGLEEEDEEGISATSIVLGIPTVFAVWAFCSATGVYMIGDLGNETGSFPVTMCGAAVGAGVGTLGGMAIDAVFDIGTIGWPFLFAVPTVGAIIGFNMTRRYKSPPAEPETALLNFSDGKMSLAVPRVYFRTDSFGRGNLSQRVDLLRVTF